MVGRWCSAGEEPSNPRTVAQVGICVFDDRGIEGEGISLDMGRQIVGLARIANGEPVDRHDRPPQASRHQGSGRRHDRSAQARRASATSEDGSGVILLEFTIAENIALHDYRRARSKRLVVPARLISRCSAIKEYDIRGGGPRDAGASRGNQQRSSGGNRGDPRAHCRAADPGSTWEQSSSCTDACRGAGRGRAVSFSLGWRRFSLSDGSSSSTRAKSW